MLRALWTTMTWTMFDQRRFIRKGFQGGETFTRHMALPTYQHSTINQRFPLGRRRVLFVQSPEHLREVFSNVHGTFNAGSSYSFLKPYFGDESVFVLEGDRHVDAKKRIYSMIRDDLEIRDDELLFLDYQAKELFTDGVYPVLPQLQRLVSSFIVRTIFGEQGTAAARNIVQHSIGAANNASATLLVLPHLVRATRRFGTGLEIRRQRRELRQFIHDQLDGLDIISDWETAQPGHTPVSRGEIIDNLMTLLIAGFETASTSLAWLFYQLARNRPLQQQLRAEILKHEAGEFVRYLADDRTLLAATVFETLRLHPSIPFVIREINADCSVAGSSLAKGDYVLLSIDEMQRRHYGDDGDGFDPRRFLGQDKHPKLCAFGGGVKICPGRALAIQIMRVVTALAVAELMMEPTELTDDRVARNRVSAAPRGGMILRISRLR